MRQKKALSSNNRTFLAMTIPIVILFFLFNTLPLITGALFSHIFGINGVAWATPVAEITSLIVSAALVIPYIRKLSNQNIDQ